MSQNTLLIISKLPEFRNVIQDLFDDNWNILRPLTSKILPSNFAEENSDISLIVLGTRRNNFENSNIPHQYQRIWPSAKIIVFVFSEAYSTTTLQYEQIQSINYAYCNFINTQKLQTLLQRGIRHFYPLLLPTIHPSNITGSQKSLQEQDDISNANILDILEEKLAIKNTPPPSSCFEETMEINLEDIEVSFEDLPPLLKPEKSKNSSTTPTFDKKISIPPQKQKRLIVVASSTGGIEALKHFIVSLPENLVVPIVIVHHIPPNFDEGLLEILQQHTHRQIKLVEDNERLRNNIYLAPFDYHVSIESTPLGSYLHLNQNDKEHYLRPAADPLFRSAARLPRTHVIGIVLTGMGRDGLVGALELHKNHGVLLCQDEQSSAVWGMPKQVYDRGIAYGLYNPSEMGNVCSQIWKM